MLYEDGPTPEYPSLTRLPREGAHDITQRVVRVREGVHDLRDRPEEKVRLGRSTRVVAWRRLCCGCSGRRRRLTFRVGGCGGGCCCSCWRRRRYIRRAGGLSTCCSLLIRFSRCLIVRVCL
uniref:Uncharacterized protein n=1 Tax=Cacopsylla melanoneura TaxID=428564 RepID=A0A8D9EMN7_9HEMI